MSRIGKKPVVIPNGTKVTLDNNKISAVGKFGDLSYEFNELVNVVVNEGEILVSSLPGSTSKKASAFWGLTRSLIKNMIEGVSEGFKKTVTLKGVGYKAAVDGKILNLSLGFSHDVKFLIPSYLKVNCTKPEMLEVSGADKQKVGQFCAKIKKLRPPEPYKGKGVTIDDEFVLRKEGKKK